MNGSSGHVGDPCRAGEESRPIPGLGSRIAERFRKIGLKNDLPELRGQRARPARRAIPPVRDRDLEFIERALSSRDAARRSGDYVPAEKVLGRLEGMLTKAKKFAC